MRVAILSDTHLPNIIRHLDVLGPEIGRFCSSVDLILHSGDISSPVVLEWLEQYAPVVAAQGNHDSFEDRRMAPVQVLDLDGWRIGMVHNLAPETRPVADLQRRFPAAVDIIIAGHTHLERLEHRDNVVLLNSGSVVFPRQMGMRLGTVALLDLSPGKLHAEVVLLGETPGLPNPGRAMTLDLNLDGAGGGPRLALP